MASKTKPKPDSADKPKDAAAPVVYEVNSKVPAALYPLIRDAWNAVRGDDGPEFDECQHQFKFDLVAHAISALHTSEILQGDGYWARFEQEVARLKQESEKVAAAQVV